MGNLDKNLVRVYRLEHAKTGEGMYTSLVEGEIGPAHEILANDCYCHPDPFDDEMLMANLEKHDVLFEQCFFCFGSIAELSKWVYKKEWLKALHERGIKLAVYICEKHTVVSGERQSMFYESVRKRQYDLKKYFKLS